MLRLLEHLGQVPQHQAIMVFIGIPHMGVQNSLSLRLSERKLKAYYSVFSQSLCYPEYHNRDFTDSRTEFPVRSRYLRRHTKFCTLNKIFLPTLVLTVPQ
jgi:hypothetical protein